MKNKKEVEQEKIDKQIIVGNCSKCNGPVMSRCYIDGVKVGEYHECLNCGAKAFPQFGKVIDMDKDNPKTGDVKWRELTKDELLNDWDKNIPSKPYNPLPDTHIPTHPWPYHDPNTSPYNRPQYPWPSTYPIITCGTGSYTSQNNPDFQVFYTLT